MFGSQVTSERIVMCRVMLRCTRNIPPHIITLSCTENAHAMLSLNTYYVNEFFHAIVPPAFKKLPIHNGVNKVMFARVSLASACTRLSVYTVNGKERHPMQKKRRTTSLTTHDTRISPIHGASATLLICPNELNSNLLKFARTSTICLQVFLINKFISK